MLLWKATPQLSESTHTAEAHGEKQQPNLGPLGPQPSARLRGGGMAGHMGLRLLVDARGQRPETAKKHSMLKRSGQVGKRASQES